jgi:AcrR family transcriptional regulator
MTRKAAPKPVRAKQRRLSPDDRRKEFVAKATEFFAEEGFGGGTRDLARRLGVTQPLLYRYFPSKDDLIKEVYRTVYLGPLDTGWEKLLADRSRPIRHRLQEFYSAYTDAIFTRKWLRIYLYSGLKGLDINRWYVGVVRDKILTRIIRECRHEAGLPVIQRVSQRRRRLRRPLIAEHPLVPGFAGELIGNLARFLGSLRRMPDRTAIDAFAGLGAHGP